MNKFWTADWQWIIGVVVVPIVVAIIGAVVKKTGRKQTVGDINGDGNHVINGDVKT